MGTKNLKSVLLFAVATAMMIQAITQKKITKAFSKALALAEEFDDLKASIEEAKKEIKDLDSKEVEELAIFVLKELELPIDQTYKELVLEALPKMHDLWEIGAKLKQTKVKKV